MVIQTMEVGNVESHSPDLIRIVNPEIVLGSPFRVAADDTLKRPYPVRIQFFVNNQIATYLLRKRFWPAQFGWCIFQANGLSRILWQWAKALSQDRPATPVHLLFLSSIYVPSTTRKMGKPLPIPLLRKEARQAGRRLKNRRALALLEALQNRMDKK
ncbi:MAG: hypothetical protein P8X96_12975 [Desulfobacteraceae bacterium]